MYFLMLRCIFIWFQFAAFILSLRLKFKLHLFEKITFHSVGVYILNLCVGGMSKQISQRGKCLLGKVLILDSHAEKNQQQ